MNNLELDFEFETAPWQRYLGSLAPGSRISAAQLLSLLESEDEQTLEDALEQCREHDIFPEIDALPKIYGSGDQAVRLRAEEQWAAKGLDPRQMEEGDPLRIFLEEVAMTPAFGDARILAQQAASGDEKAMTLLMNLSLGTIVQLAGEYTGRGVALMDLIQEGSLGLMQAVYSGEIEDFREKSDWNVRFFMARAVILQAHAYGVGQNVRQNMEDYRNVDEQLLTELGRNATVAEIAEAMHISPEQAETLGNMVTIARKLKQATPEEESDEPKPEDEQAVEDTAYFQTRQRISDMMSGLSAREAKLIALRFGLEGGMPLSPDETGRKLGLTPDEVVAIEAAALAKMRKQ